ncbi:hypothetical protein K7432_010378 [Basidiobolus ranarum]|uniref:Uncharacterized protein n=1 Tax=Basidiobolus ranarum TaxID=34480 RepID=A0ABR2WNV7_9FUNG
MYSADTPIYKDLSLLEISQLITIMRSLTRIPLRPQRLAFAPRLFSTTALRSFDIPSMPPMEASNAVKIRPIRKIIAPEATSEVVNTQNFTTMDRAFIALLGKHDLNPELATSNFKIWNTIPKK